MRFDVNCILDALGLGEDDAEIKADIEAIIKEKEEELKLAASFTDDAVIELESISESAKDIDFRMKRNAYYKLMGVEKQNKLTTSILEDLSNLKNVSPSKVVRAFKTRLNGTVETSIATAAEAQKSLAVANYKEELYREGGKDLMKYLKSVEDSDIRTNFKNAVIALKDDSTADVSRYLPNKLDQANAIKVRDAMLRSGEWQYDGRIASGIALRKQKNYLNTISLDKNRMTSKAEFVEMAEETFDHKRVLKLYPGQTMPSVAKRAEFYAGMYDIIQGVKTEESGQLKTGGFGVTQARDLFFKDSFAEAEFLNKFDSQRSVYELISTNSYNMGVDVGVFTFGGRKAKNTYLKSLNDIVQKGYFKDKDGKNDLRAIAKVEAEISRVMDAVAGTGARDPYSNWVVGAQTLRMLQYFNLGSVAKTSMIADMTNRMIPKLYRQGGSVSRASADIKRQLKSTLTAKVRDEQKVILLEKLTGITRGLNKMMAGHTRYGDLGELNPDTWVDKTHNYVRGAVGKYMDTTGIGYLTKVQQQADVIDSGNFIMDVFDGKIDNQTVVDQAYIDMGLTRAERSALDRVIKDQGSKVFISKEGKDVFGLDLFDPNNIIELDNSYFSTNTTRARRMKNEMATKLRGYLNAVATTGVTEINAAEGVKAVGGGDLSRVAQVLFTAFKPTIIRQTADNIHIVSKMLDLYGVQGAMKSAMLYSLSAAVTGMAIEAIWAQVFNEESIFEKIFNSEDPEDGIADLIDKISPAPLGTDLVTNMMRNKRKYGRSSFSNNVLGVMGQKFEDFERAFSAKPNKRADKFAKATIGISGLQGITSTHWLPKLIMKWHQKELKYNTKARRATDKFLKDYKGRSALKNVFD